MVYRTEYYSCIFKKIVSCVLPGPLYLHLQAHHACSSEVMKLCIIQLSIRLLAASFVADHSYMANPSPLCPPALGPSITSGIVTLNNTQLLYT